MKRNNDLSFFELVLRAANNCLAHFKLFAFIIVVPTAIMFYAVMWGYKPIYSAEAIVTPPAAKSSLGGLSKALDGISGMSSMSSLLGNSDQAINIVWTFLNSRELHQKVIDKFDFFHRYEFDQKPTYFKADVLKTFRKNFSFELNDEEMFYLSFEDEDYELAAQVLEYILVQADSMYNSYKTTQARQSRTYIDSRIVDVEKTIDSLRAVFTEFQSKNNYYDPEVQLESTLKYLNALQADRDAISLQLAYEKDSHSEKTKHMEELERRLKAVDVSIAQAQNGKRSKNGIVSLEKSPDLTAQYFTLENEMRIQETVYKFLRQEREQLVLEEVNTPTNLVVLQAPWPNDKKIFPRRSVMLLFTMLVAGIFSTLLCNFIEFCKNVDKDSAFAMEGKRLRNFFKKSK